MFKWKMYNHAIIPDEAPYAEPNKDDICKACRMKGLFVKYTTNFDCNNATDWWYVIKDGNFDLSELKAKHRYEITSGLKNIDVKIINAENYSKELYDVYISATNSYSGFKNSATYENFKAKCDNCKKNEFYYGAFQKSTNILVGYALCVVHDDYVDFQVLKIDPKYLKLKASAAIVYTLLTDYLSKENIKFICDGERSIRHKTHFQDYLEKYFGFRKAYCKLNIIYNSKFYIILKLVFPLRKILDRFSNNAYINNISSMCKIEELLRKNKGQ